MLLKQFQDFSLLFHLLTVFVNYVMCLDEHMEIIE